MAELEEKLGAILGNRKMMEQIMAMAQMMQSPEDKEPQLQEKSQAPPPPAPPMSQGIIPGLDLGSMEKIFSLAQQAGIDRQQQALLRALSPYLSAGRLAKLEKAMRAAKLSAIAASALGSDRLPFFSGR